MSATSEGVERRNLQGPYTAARRRLVHAERDVTEAAEASEAADAALFAQQSVRAFWVLTCVVPSTASRSSIPRSPRCAAARSRAWSSEPPEYVVALLGPRPSRSRPRATVAAGHRRDRGLATLAWRKRWLRLAERVDACARPAERGLGGPKAPARRREPRGGATRPRSRGDRSCSGRERRSFARPGDGRGARAR